MDEGTTTILVDADNTLWDTDKVFADAQLALLRCVEDATGKISVAQNRLAFVRELDQLIAQTHHARLRYPPRLLVKAIALRLAGRSAEAAAKSAWNDVSNSPTALAETKTEEAERCFLGDLKKVPELRTGVSQGIPSLRQIGCRIVVFTEGNREKCDALLHHYGLREYVEQIIEGPKQVDTFRRLGRLRVSKYPAIAIGDQLDRDIAPAKQAGLITVYFPGGFRPKWEPQEAKIMPDFRIESFEQVAAIIEHVRLPVTLADRSEAP